MTNYLNVAEKAIRKAAGIVELTPYENKSNVFSIVAHNGKLEVSSVIES